MSPTTTHRYKEIEKKEAKKTDEEKMRRYKLRMNNEDARVEHLKRKRFLLSLSISDQH